MPRSNLSDFDGESLTSDEEGLSPTSPVAPRTADWAAKQATASPDAPATTSADAPAASSGAAAAAAPTSPTRSTRSAKPPAVKIPSPPAYNDASGTTPAAAGDAAAAGKAILRFRGVVRKVMQLHHVSRGLSGEPGVDVRRSATARLYQHIHEQCDIEVIDYNQTTIDAKSYNNQEFIRWLKSPEFERKSWSKVRWINISGISWDIVSQLGLKYPLHPLALEDLLSNRKLARSKAEYFAHHLFLRVACHELMTDEEARENIVKGLERSSSPTRMTSSQGTLTDEKRYVSDEENGSVKKGLRRRRGRSGQDDLEGSPASSMFRAPSEVETKPTPGHTKQHLAVEQLKQGDRINVGLRYMCIFLTRDGTIISFLRAPNLAFTSHISLRIKTRGSGLRINPDASMMVHALLDLTVDRAMEVMDAYHEKILQLEGITLLRPKMSTVRSLHIISGDLILHKRTMEPLKHLCYGLRRYDTDRCIALAEDADPGVDRAKVKGFMSHKAKIYLADVVDHVEHILSSMDMFSATAENLINYTFNLTSANTNNVMRKFTIVTIVCLPLTLLSGYFGMNFSEFQGIYRSDLFYWEIGIPLVIVVLLLTLSDDIKKAIHIMHKAAVSKKHLK